MAGANSDLTETREMVAKLHERFDNYEASKFAPTSSNNWITFAKAFGIPSTLLLMIFIGVYTWGNRFAVWAEPKASQMLSDHLETTKVFREQMTQQTRIVKGINTKLEEHGRLLHDLHDLTSNGARIKAERPAIAPADAEDCE